MTLLYPILVLPLLAAAVTSESDAIVRTPTKGEPVTLNCSVVHPNGTLVPQHWVTNDGTWVTANDTMKYIQVLENGWQLRITSVELNHLGTYKCYGESRDHRWNATYTIDLQREPPSMWSIYKWNVIIGVVAAVVTLIIIVGIYLLYQCKWENRHLHDNDKTILKDREYVDPVVHVTDEDEAYSTPIRAKLQQHGIEGYSNEVFEADGNDEDKTIHDTKM